MSASDLRIVLVGWGAISSRVATLLANSKAPVRIVAVAVRDTGKPRDDLPDGARLLTSPNALETVPADLVIEAAGRGSVAVWGRKALSLGVPFAVSSTSAFADPGLLEELVALAAEKGSALLIPPGALGGIDALAAAGRLGLNTVIHDIIKPPAAWMGTRAEELCDLGRLEKPTVFFEGSAREASSTFPQNANAALITALAGIGIERTRVRLIADPETSLNAHHIQAEGDFGRLDVRLDNRPLATNPKSSEMTALNLVRLIENNVTALRL